MEHIRFGIIGFGTQGATYCHLLRGTSPIPGLPAREVPANCSLGAISTSNPQKAAAIREQFPGVPVFASWQELLRSGTCDAVIPTVPHFQHHEIAIAAMEAGLHVLSEKPAAIRAWDARAMADAAARTGKILGLFYNQRTNSLYRRLKEILDSGELGNIRRSVWIINSWWRPDAYYQQNDWRATWGGEGGGVLVNQAPHQLDLWQWLCGVPTEITAMAINGAHRDIATENDVTVMARYPSGATGVFITCTHDPLGTDRLEIDCDGGKILVEGGKTATILRLKKDGAAIDEGWMNRNISMAQLQQLTQSNGTGGLYETEVLTCQDGWGVQHGKVLANFAAHLLTGTPLLADGTDGLRGVQLANAIQLSGWTGKTVPNPCDEAAYNEALNRLIAQEGKFPLR